MWFYVAYVVGTSYFHKCFCKLLYLDILRLYLVDTKQRFLFQKNSAFVCIDQVLHLEPLLWSLFNSSEFSFMSIDCLLRCRYDIKILLRQPFEVSLLRHGFSKWFQECLCCQLRCGADLWKLSLGAYLENLGWATWSLFLFVV